MSEIENLYKWANVEKLYLLKYTINGDYFEFTGNQEQIDLFLKDIFSKPSKKFEPVEQIGFYPLFTAEKAWKLEEIVRQKDYQHNLRYGDCAIEGEVIYSFLTGNEKSPFVHTGSGKTREEALASLIPKINWTKLEKQEIKKILEQ